MLKYEISEIELLEFQ